MIEVTITVDQFLTPSRALATLRRELPDFDQNHPTVEAYSHTEAMDRINAQGRAWLSRGYRTRFIENRPDGDFIFAIEETDPSVIAEAEASSCPRCQGRMAARPELDESHAGIGRMITVQKCNDCGHTVQSEQLNRQTATC